MKNDADNSFLTAYREWRAANPLPVRARVVTVFIPGHLADAGELGTFWLVARGFRPTVETFGSRRAREDYGCMTGTNVQESWLLEEEAKL
jgi:hypothetical protein